MPENPPGQIITFYSYKGGTGRSMALANVAWILASSGKRVLIIDWDLEAPGLHRYFHPFLVDKELSSTEGLIDFFVEFAVTAATPLLNESRDRDWYRTNANILRYAVSLEHEFPSGGFIDLVPAGKQGSAYSTRVNSFNWDGFYERMGGGVFIEAFKEHARREYQYILIDSRTGVSDTSGICTVQLPDVLVVCFTLNTQGIEGSAAVARSALDGYEDRRKYGFQSADRLRILPVPMRIENAEYRKLERQLARARAAFTPVLAQMPPREADQYWGAVQFPYIPFYAYEEILATVGDRGGDPKQLLAAAERLTGYITGGAVHELAPLDDADRRALLARFEEQPAPSPTPSQTASPPQVLSPAPVAVPVAAAAVRPLVGASEFRRLRIIGAAFVATIAVLLVAIVVVLQQATSRLQTAVIAIETAAPTAAPTEPAVADLDPTAPATPAPVAAISTPTVRSTSVVAVATSAGKAAPTPTPVPVLTWRQEASLSGHTNGVWSAQFSPDGSLIVTGSGDGTARLWDVASHQEIKPALQHGTDGVWSAAFSPDGKQVVTAGNDGTARLWSVADHQPVGLMSGKFGPMYQAAFSPDGSLVVTANADGTAQLWDVATRQPLGQPLAWTNGTGIGALNEFRPVRDVWATTFIAAGPARRGQEPVWSAAFSPDGKSLVTGNNDGTAALWDVATRQPLGVLQGHTGPVISAAFSPDGKLVVTSSGDGTARVWDVASRMPVDPQLGPGPDRKIVGQVWGAAFSPDGKLVLTASGDGAVRIWDSSSHQLTAELTGLTGEVHEARMNPDLDRIVSSSSDGTVLLWAARAATASAVSSTTPTPTPTPVPPTAGPQTVTLTPSAAPTPMSTPTPTG